jgi:PadR family transcriptional regulator, regulatory protein PadR
MARKKDDADSQRLTAIDEDILTALASRELYGLEILARLNRGRSSQLSFGSLYPALSRLESKGFVEWRWGEEEDGSGGARRKYYKATALGQGVLSTVQNYRRSLK